MPLSFLPGDDLIFQLESGYGLIRVLARDDDESTTIWHLLAYEDLFPDVESAEKALSNPASLTIRNAHMALTDRAFERTPAAKLSNRPVSDDELAAYKRWQSSDEKLVHDRSVLLMLGLR